MAPPDPGPAQPPRLAPVLAAVLLAGLVLAGCLGPDAEDPAPVFEVRTAESGAWNLTDHRGTPVVLDFMATWCEPCKRQSRELGALQEQGPNASILSLSVDPEGDNATVLRDWKEDHDAIWPHAPDDEGVHLDYGVTGIPTIVVVDAEGDVSWTSSGREVVEQPTLSSRVEAAR